MTNSIVSSPKGRRFVWQEGRILDEKFVPIIAITKMSSSTGAIAVLLPEHSRIQVKLYTHTPKEIERRAAVLYDMTADALEGVATAAETGFMLMGKHND